MNVSLTQEQKQWLIYAQKKIDAGLADMQTGRFITSEEFISELKKKRKETK